MRRSLMVASVGFGVLALAIGATYLTVYFERVAVLRVAVSSTDAEDFDLMGAAGRLLKRGHHKVHLKVVGTDGAAAASAALDAGAADLAVVRSDVAVPSNGETVVLLHKDVGLLVAPGGSAIGKIGDLGGKSVGIVSEGLGDDRLLGAALAQYDLAPDSVKTIPLKIEDIGSALKAKTVDAVLAVGLASSGVVPAMVKAVAAAGDGPPVFLPVAEAAAIAERAPGYESIEVVRGAFGGSPPKPADEFDTLGVTYRLVANADLDQGAVAALTRFLLSERVALAQIAPAARRMEAPSTDRGGAIPVHPGSAAYIDDEEETFLDRYSDFIYIGAMVLGVMASGATAIFSRFSAVGAASVEELVARLLVIFKAVRATQLLDSLDQYEDEVDGIVASALDAGGLRSLDERRVAMLNMAVDQVRAAIRDRRDSLRRGGLRGTEDAPRIIEGSSTPTVAALSHQAGAGR